MTGVGCGAVHPWKVGWLGFAGGDIGGGMLMEFVLFVVVVVVVVVVVASAGGGEVCVFRLWGCFFSCGCVWPMILWPFASTIILIYVYICRKCIKISFKF